MSDHDQYAQWDAAYVLGSLSGEDRAEYEEHLAGCPACRAAVAELAGLPGLLGQLSPAEAMAVESTGGGGTASGPFADPLVLPDPPASLMPRLPSSSAAGSSSGFGGAERRRWLAPLAAAAAALVIGGVGGYAVSASRDAVPGDRPSTTQAVGSARLAFTTVKASPMTAVVDVVPTRDGTELVVECQYAPSGTSTTSATGDGRYAGTRYGIWVVGRDGRQMLVKDWTARTGRIMHPSGTTLWDVSQIAAVEIRVAGSDDPVLRARLT